LKERTRSVYVRLPEDVVVKLDRLAESLGLSRSRLVRALLETFLSWNYAGYPEEEYRYKELFEKLIKRGLEPESALRFIMLTRYNYAWCIGNIVEKLYRDYFKTTEADLVLEDMDWLKDYEGIWFYFITTSVSKHLFDSLIFQIQKDWDGYAIVYKHFYEEDYGGGVREIVNRIRNAINSQTGQELISEFEDLLYECADIAEFKVDVDYDELGNEGVLSVEIYVSEWQCMPSLAKIDKLIRKLLEIAGVKASKPST